MRVPCLLVFLMFRLVPTTAEDPVKPPPERWVMDRTCISARAGNEEPGGSILMADVIRMEGGGLRLYYNRSGPEGSEVRCAESRDGLRWEGKGTVLRGGKRGERTFVTGGPRVVHLPDGRWRMYSRCAPSDEPGTPPAYHALSAVSPDGLNFTREPGVRIEIAPHEPGSPFSLAGHGAFYALEDGTWAAVISADPVGERGPSDLYLATSADGLTWGGYRQLYRDCHDPTVLEHEGKYHLFALYLRDYAFHAVSPDGLTWPERAVRVELLDERGGDLLDQNAGDLCAAADLDGRIRLYSNHGRPSTAIVSLARRE